MKRLTLTLCFSLVSLGGSLADHHEGDELAKKIDALLTGISQPDEAERYEPRMGLNALTSAASAPGSSTRDAYVKLLLERLKNPETAMAAKAWIIRQLEDVGAAESVPALKALFGSPFHHLRELSRRALEQNPSSEAGAALRELSENEHDRNVRRALVHSIGERADGEAVAWLRSQLESKDRPLQRAVIEALGKVANDAALDALDNAYEEGPDRELAADALLESARRLTPDHSDRAVAVLKRLYGYDQPARLQAAAFRGLLQARPGEADDLILLALQSKVPAVRQVAINACRGLPATSVIPNVLAVKLAELSPDEQAMALAVLGDTQDPTVASQLADMLESGALVPAGLEASVLDALGQLGGADAAARVADFAGRTPDEDLREAAREALAEMPGEAVDAWLVSATLSGDLAVRLEAIRALGARAYGPAKEVLLAHLENGPRAIQQGSLEALSQIATVEDIPRLLPYVASDDDGAAKVIMQACRRASAAASSLSQGVAVVVQAIADLPAGAKPKLVPCLAILGGEEALAAVKDYLKGETLRSEALKALTNWPGPEAGPSLIDLAKSEGVEDVERTLLLRGLVRLIGNPRNDLELQRRLQLAKEAVDASQKVEDQRLFLPVLGGLRTREALEALVALLDHPPLAEEAALAILSSMERRGQRGGGRRGGGRDLDRHFLQDVLKKVVRADVEAETADRAAEILDRM